MTFSPPKDVYNTVYFIMMLNGVGVLLPWNMLTTIAPSYYVDYKLTTYYGNGTIEYQPDLAKDFFSYLGIFAQFPNFLLNLINLFLRIKGDLTKRVIYSLLVLGSGIVFTIVFIFIDTSSWIIGFFWMSMASFFVINAASGMYQNSIYGISAVLPMEFTNSVILGNNICGTFISIINIITIAGSNNPKVAATAYFVVSLAVIVLCFFSIPFLKKLEFYRYYNNLAKTSTQNQNDKVEHVELNMATYCEVFKKGWQQMLNVFLVFFVSLTIYPTILTDILPTNYNDNNWTFFISKKFFSPILCFLLFNFFASAGNMVAGYIPIKYKKIASLIIIIRLLFIPFFIFCNFRPESRTWTVIFKNEWWYIIGNIIMATTSGYFSSLSMMLAPQTVEASKSHIAGMMAAFFLISGICAGVGFTFFVTYFTEQLGPLKPLKS
ncbi:Equilibrative nucleoside transporter 3 [Strongyloides ratti]|uniref:Equilibrative nucleoside transporter 3 n=1 Tax=Strongyloides ratti TaxID=34506 RepID=A0A090MVJ2_STRRB|nr:Equilibrative nucleoside transporter 3 [Strongyloides ratti]CEF62943.1 Equilibrative nucleoside transporter 3 [Strongyloides ratti]